MSVVYIKCEVFHHRIFDEGQGKSIDISKSRKYGLYFEIKKLRAGEERRLVLTDKNNRTLLTVPLNKFGGQSPFLTSGLPEGAANGQPGGTFRLNVECDTDLERLFYRDIDLSTDSDIQVELNIKDPDLLRKSKSKFVFKTRNSRFARFNNLEITVRSKKPIESGDYLFYFETKKDFLKHLNKQA